jgi:hypothetical protein
MRSLFSDAEVKPSERHLDRLLQIRICIQTGGRVIKSTRPVSICLPLSIALLATEDVDDLERAIEISSLSPLIPTVGAN